MSDQHPARPQRAVVDLPFVALTAVTLTCAYSFVRLLDGTSFLWPLLAVGLIAHIVSLLGRRWHWRAAVAAPAAAVASLVAMVAMRYRSHALLGLLPTGSVLSQMRSDLTGAADAFRNVVTPTAPLPGFVLGLGALIVLIAVAADALAFRLGARAEALVPATGLFVFGAVLGGPRLRLTSTGLFAAAALLFVLVDRVGRGRVADRWMVGNRRLEARNHLQAGVLIVAATSFVGIAAATAAPRHDQSPWTRWRGADQADTRITVSPLVDLHDRLVRETNTLLFTVRADRPAYWRITALDDYHDSVWSSNNSFSKADGNLDHPSQATRSTELRQRFDLINLAQVWAPAAYQATHISGTSNLLYDPGSATLIVRRGYASSDGLEYSITSQVPALTPADLTAGGKPMGSADLAHYTALPADLPPTVRATAREVVGDAGATTEYAKARALQDWFRNNFTYSLQPGLDEVGGPPITAFLHKREGWCEQFAGTYAVMARALGLPARVAVGFTPGQATTGSVRSFAVYGRQAHAWPEVWFPGEGWVAFEPTPGRGAPGNESYTGVPFQQDVATSGPPATLPNFSPRVDANPTTTAPSAAQPARPTTTVPAGAGARRPSGAVSRVAAVLAFIGIGIVAAALLALGALAGARWWLRERRRRRARTDAARVAVAWSEACDALALVAPPPQRSETRLEYAARVGDREAPAGSVSTLARLATDAVWDDQPSSPDREQADALAGDIDRAVRDELGPWRHATTALRPRTLRELAKRD